MSSARHERLADCGVSSSEISMNTRLALPLTAAVSFALTCGVLLWNRRDGARTPIHAAVDAVEPAPTSADLPRAAALAPASVAAEAPAVDSPEMPVQFTLRRSPATNSYFGAVLNAASGSLMIDVAVFSPHSHQTQTGRIRIEAGQLAKFGVDDGLVINAGDRVSLHSVGYRDIVDQLPTLEPDVGPAEGPAA
jgi:hypothetical protein